MPTRSQTKVEAKAHSTAISSRKTEQVPYLPTEIWSRILTFAIQSHNGVQIRVSYPFSQQPHPYFYAHSLGPMFPRKRSLLSGQILRVNKLFLSEGRRALYGQTLEVDHLLVQQDVVNFTYVIGCENVGAVRSMHLLRDGDDDYLPNRKLEDIFSEFHHLPNLRVVSVWCRIGIWELCLHLNPLLRLFAGAKLKKFSITFGPEDVLAYLKGGVRFPNLGPKTVVKRFKKTEDMVERLRSMEWNRDVEESFGPDLISWPAEGIYFPWHRTFSITSAQYVGVVDESTED